MIYERGLQTHENGKGITLTKEELTVLRDVLNELI